MVMATETEIAVVASLYDDAELARKTFLRKPTVANAIRAAEALELAEDTQAALGVTDAELARYRKGRRN